MHELEKNKQKNESQASKAEKEKKPTLAGLDGQPIDFGDDGDKTIFSLKCKVFELSNGQWTEKGIGIVKLNTFLIQNDDDKKEAKKEKLRILCRREIVENTIINGMVHKNTKFIKRNENSITFVISAADSADKAKSFLLRSKEKDKTKVDAFLNKISEIQQ